MPCVDLEQGKYVVLAVLKLSRTLIQPTPQSFKLEQILLQTLQYVSTESDKQKRAFQLLVLVWL